MPYKKSSYQIAVAAEAIAAAFFARMGCDVSVQYGANQPEYDLMIADGDDMLKVSVKGSQDGSWGLTQSFLTKTKADYKVASAKWLEKHGKRTIFCLVQFKGVELDEAPRVYLATPAEIAKQLNQSRNGHGDTILYENHTWRKNSKGYPNTEKLPENWRISKNRIKELFKIIEKQNA